MPLQRIASYGTWHTGLMNFHDRYFAANKQWNSRRRTGREEETVVGGHVIWMRFQGEEHSMRCFELKNSPREFPNVGYHLFMKGNLNWPRSSHVMHKLSDSAERGQTPPMNSHLWHTCSLIETKLQKKTRTLKFKPITLIIQWHKSSQCKQFSRYIGQHSPKKDQTYDFKWLGPSSVQHSNEGGFQLLAAQISRKRDLAVPRSTLPEKQLQMSESLYLLASCKYDKHDKPVISTSLSHLRSPVASLGCPPVKSNGDRDQASTASKRGGQESLTS